MDARHGCFELMTACGDCGQPMPVNAPTGTVLCTACSKTQAISHEILAGFFEDFEEEYEGLERGQGSGGTLMGGGGTFEYGMWRLPPRCGGCKRDLPVVPTGTEGPLHCPHCGRGYHTYPAPAWMREAHPSATQCFSSEPPGDGRTVEAVRAPDPVAMGCPQCGAGLTIDASAKRTTPCAYCQTAVFIPDELWKRLHPVKQKAEWWVRFEGPSVQERLARQRRADEEAEKTELAGWRPRHRPNHGKTALYVGLGIGGYLLLLTGLAGGLALLGVDSETRSAVVGMVFLVGFVGGSLLVGSSQLIGAVVGGPSRSKNGLAQLCEARAWKHWGVEHRLTQGYAQETWKGRDVEVKPDDDYAITIEIDDSPFHLQTEPPAYPRDGLVRFATGDPQFDSLFPIRYASPKIARRLETSLDDLAPIYWFIRRWGPHICRLKIDWSEIGVHLAPGGIKRSRHGTRWLEPHVYEPLLEDTMIVARAIDAIAHGKSPQLPDLPMPPSPEPQR